MPKNKTDFLPHPPRFLLKKVSCTSFHAIGMTTIFPFLKVIFHSIYQGKTHFP